MSSGAPVASRRGLGRPRCSLKVAGEDARDVFARQAPGQEPGLDLAASTERRVRRLHHARRIRRGLGVPDQEDRHSGASRPAC